MSLFEELLRIIRKRKTDKQVEDVQIAPQRMTEEKELCDKETVIFASETALADEKESTVESNLSVEGIPTTGENLSATQIDDEFAEFEEEEETEAPSSTIKTTVYLGIDFGTSFSKLAYWVDENNRGAISIDGNYFINTSVFASKDSISISNSVTNFVEIKYFKYEMIPNTNGKSLFNKEMRSAIDHLVGKSGTYSLFARNCAIYYVAYLLKRCGEYIGNKYASYQFIVNMGMPVAEGVKNQRIFEEILFCAYRLFEDKLVSDVMEYGLLDKYCSDYLREFGQEKLDSKYPLYVTSEVIAEADFLLHQQTYEVGNYVIADIGGGTADFAFINKCADKEIGEYDVIWYSIVPHGIETKKDNPNYSRNLENSYYEFLNNSKIVLDSNHINEVTYILFGGGSYDEEVKTVFKCLNGRREIRTKFILKSDNRSFPDHHQISHLDLSELDKKRLVIACQLSYPDRPKVGFMPPTKENLEIIKKEIATRESKRTNYHESLEDRLTELYGN